MTLARIPLLAAAISVALAAAAEAQDVIRLKNGSEIKVKVTALTSQSVTYSEGAGKISTAKKDDVLEVILGDPPPSLGKADAALMASKYDGAINNYQQALEELGQKKAREIHKQFILYRIAQALFLKGSPNEALEKYRQLRNEVGDSWLRSDSFQRSLEIAKTKGGESYEGILKEMRGEPEPVGSQAELELAKLKYTAAEFDAARAGFEKVASNSSSPFAGEAKLFSLRSLRGLKKMDELEAACKRILDDKGPNPPALLQAAGAWIADLQLKKNEKDKTKWRDVLMTCIQSISLGPPTDKDEAEDYALALVTGAKCYVLMSNASDKAEAKEEYKTRAIGYYTEVKRAFGKTSVAEVAQKELVALGAEQPKPPSK